MCVNKFMQTSKHFNLNDQKFFHRKIHVYVPIRHIHTVVWIDL